MRALLKKPETGKAAPLAEAAAVPAGAWNSQIAYQQVNLYQPVFRQPHKVFSTVTLLQILAGVTVLLLGLYIHAQIKLGSLQRTASTLGEQHQQLETRLIALQAMEAPAPDDAQAAELRALEDSAAEYRELLGKIEQLAIRPNPGFGDVLESLARHTLPGLWLTGLELRDDGELELRGSARDPQLVPRYLQQLPSEPRFRALRLGSVNIVRREPGKPEIDFVLDSAGSEWGRP